MTTWHRWGSLAAVTGLLAATVTAAAAPGEPPRPRDTAAAPGVHDPGFALYYVVRSRSESLRDIAARLLRDGGRAGELLRLNAHRPQPDGGRLGHPDRLEAGWVLLLPWDAVGDSIRYGLLTPSVPEAPTGRAACGPAPPPGTGRVPWAQLRIGVTDAWERGTGAGVTVAVLASGIDPHARPLTGRVRDPIDIGTVPDTGRADCTGHGTALAGLVAAAPGTGPVGTAPGATLLPIRLAATEPAPDDLAAAVSAAVAAGASVVLLPAPVDDRTAGAIAAVAGPDVLVVCAAGTTAGGVPDGVLRVGGTGPDDLPIDAYPPGAADVLAPGAELTSVGLGGGEVTVSGAGYAAAYVAGVAAVLRAAEPALDAAGVAARIRDTATPLDGAAGGMISPVAAVRPLAEPGTGQGWLGALALCLLLAAATGTLAVGGPRSYRR